MKKLSLIAAGLLFAGVAGTASAETAFVGQVERPVDATQSAVSRSEVADQARQPSLVSPYLVSGDRFVPTNPGTRAQELQSRQMARENPRVPYQPMATTTPNFIGG